jgi:Flp pilus assembly protein TadD/lysophospholipase L1-like esterase
MEKTKIRSFCTGILFALLLLGLLEAGLRVFGYQGPSALEDPYLGFEEVYPLFGERESSDGRSIFATNPNKLNLFNYQEYMLPKPPNVFRIFCFGGSTVYGRPFRGETAFPRWLEILLNSMDPSRHYEVINAGGISYASYRIVHLVEEALLYDPDLFIVYSGHNEFLERRTYQAVFERSKIVRKAARTLSRLKIYDLMRQLVYSFRGQDISTGKPLLPAEVETILNESAGLDYYSRDTIQKTETCTHFQENLILMDQIAKRGEIPSLYLSVVSNIADFSPFKSEHRSDLSPEELIDWENFFRAGRNSLNKGKIELSLASFLDAYRIDNQYAELLFFLGRTTLRQGKIDLAQDYFRQARDEDVCPLRAPGEINEIISEAGNRMSINVLDMTVPFAERNEEISGHPIPGNALFLDHLHPTIEGHQIMAGEIARELIRSGMLKLSEEWDPAETQRKYDDVLNSLPDEYFAEGNLNLGKVLMWARKVREALHPLKVAAERLPGNADTHFTLGTCFKRLGRSREAIEEFRLALSLDPENNKTRNNLAIELQRQGDLEGARREFRKILESEPENLNVINNMGLIYFSTGNLEEAEATFLSVLRINDKNAEAFNHLGIIQMTREDFEKAEMSFRNACELRPNYREALNNLARVLIVQGKTDEATIICKEALLLFPYSPEFHNNLGEIYMALGKSEEARGKFITSLSLRPDWKIAQDNLESIPILDTVKLQ